jgi:hypothetical protein
MKKRPVSAFAKVGGPYFLARTFDNIRLSACDELHEEYREFIGRGSDGRVSRFARIGYDALKQRVLIDGNDEEAFTWCEQNGRRLDNLGVRVWNGFASKHDWRDEATPALRQNQSEGGLVHRNDPLAFFDCYEVNEGRASR